MSPERKRQLVRDLLQPVVAVSLTLLIGFAIVVALSNEPLVAYRSFLFSSFQSPQNFALLLNRSASLIIVAIGTVFAFRAGVFNIGGEGQLYAGAMAATACALAFPTLPPGLHIIFGLLASLLAGAVCAAIPAILKITLAVDEVVTTMMFNFIATLTTLYVVTSPLRDPTAYGATSALFPESLWLPSLPGLPGASLGIVVALVGSALAWVMLFRTEWGANLRIAGSNPRFAETIGIAAGGQIAGAMLLSGALAGLAGGLYVLGVGHRFEQNFSPGFGLIAVTTALLARVHPLGVVVTSVFYAMILNGAAYMQVAADVPRSLVNLLTGIMVVLLTAEFRRRSQARS